MRLLVVLVLMLAVLAAGLFLDQGARSRAQLREQVLLQTEGRTQNLAEAMAGQMEGLFGSVDLALLQLRREWLLHGPSATFDRTGQEILASLPAGLVSHMVVTNAEGDVVYISLDAKGKVNLADRDYFRAQRAGGDHLVIGEPVRSRLDDRWAFAMSHPVLRDGNFDGTVHATVSTDSLAASLAGLKLMPDDVVSLVQADGRVLARSVRNADAMVQTAPSDGAFLVNPLATSGVFHATSSLDQIARTYGWQRLPGSGAVVVVGIADSSAFDPMVPGLLRSQRSAIALSLLLLGCGGVIAFLLWRVAQSQDEAILSERRLKEAQQLAHLGNWNYEVAEDHLVWSDEVYRIFGLEPQSKRMTLQDYLALVHPDDLADMVRRYKDVSVPDKLHDATHRILMPDGQLKHVRELWVNEVAGGRVVRNRGTVQDVDAMHTVQVELRQLNEQLESRVEERTRELSGVNQDLEAFAYSVSHDLRTPLRSIHGFATLLQEECKDMQGEAPVFLKRIQDAAMRMGSLITDLLSMAHHSRAPLRHQVVSLSEMAREIVEELERGSPERRVQWSIEGGLQALADPMLMRMVLQNFLGNAWKYSKEVEQARIRFSRTLHEDGMQEFCVRDNGAGFDMAYVDQLFQPFKRLHTNQQFEGSGVGLATVHRAVQRHGGTVRGEGALGQGAAFYFTLPDFPVVQEDPDD
jgi:signal transduction histidine kinase